MPITPQSLDFLFENRLKNDRDWFRANRRQYTDLVEAPLLELAGQLGPAVLDIDPLITAQPRRCLSRIWLDMRINRSGQYFRDHMWLVFRRGKGMAYPAFYFEISPGGCGYGMGYYATAAPVMDTLRQWVLRDDKRYLDAQKALDALPGFVLAGEEYKRLKFPDAPKQKQPWLNRKGLSVNCEGVGAETLFSPSLAETLQTAFRRLAPIYQFFLQAHLQTMAEGGIPAD